jgi:hypothetical protein
MSSANRAMRETFQIRSAAPRGLGLFAMRNYRAGDRLFDFEGIVLPHAEASPLALQIGDQSFLEESPGELLPHLNHSCDPNSRVVFGRWFVSLVAACRIAEWQEVAFDYDTTEADLRGDGCSFVCRCGSPACRGLIEGFKHSGGEPVWRRR